MLSALDMGSVSRGSAFRGLLDDLIGRGLTAPSFVIIDGAAGLEKALGLVWPDALMQRCTVHKHRNLLAHAPERLHEEVSADYNDMIYAGTPKRRSKNAASHSFASGDGNVVPLPTAWRMPVIGCSPSFPLAAVAGRAYRRGPICSAARTPLPPRCCKFAPRIRQMPNRIVQVNHELFGRQCA